MRQEYESVVIEAWVQRLKSGGDEARQQLINCACERLTHLTRKMLRDYDRVKRWEETDDIVQNSLMRLYRTLAEVQPQNAIEFYRLAALNIRRELLDLAKHYFGPCGLGANYASMDGMAAPDKSVPFSSLAVGENVDQFEDWAAFHDRVEHLPQEEREVFDLLWYQQLSQTEVAELLNLSERTVKRRWAAARLSLNQALGGLSPES